MNPDEAQAALDTLSPEAKTKLFQIAVLRHLVVLTDAFTWLERAAKTRPKTEEDELFKLLHGDVVAAHLRVFEALGRMDPVVGNSLKGVTEKWKVYQKEGSNVGQEQAG